MAIYRRKKTRQNRYERDAENRRVMESRSTGKGCYIYRNRSQTGSLTLPKPSLDGEKVIPPGETWKGDDYFMYMVNNHEATLVEAISTGAEPMENKLILDQPEQVTEAGKVEHVEVDQPLIEAQPSEDKKPEEVLLNEDPLDGVEIILD